MGKKPEIIDGIDISDYPEHIKVIARKKFQLPWIESIEKVLKELGGVSDLATITDRVAGLRDLTNNSHLDATVRAVLNSNEDHFDNPSRGVWRLVNRKVKS